MFWIGKELRITLLSVFRVDFADRRRIIKITLARLHRKSDVTCMSSLREWYLFITCVLNNRVERVI